jgi:hypothetical protein
VRANSQLPNVAAEAYDQLQSQAPAPEFQRHQDATDGNGHLDTDVM